MFGVGDQWKRFELSFVFSDEDANRYRCFRHYHPLFKWQIWFYVWQVALKYMSDRLTKNHMVLSFQKLFLSRWRQFHDRTIWIIWFGQKLKHIWPEFKGYFFNLHASFFVGLPMYKTTHIHYTECNIVIWITPFSLRCIRALFVHCQCHTLACKRSFCKALYSNTHFTGYL